MLSATPASPPPFISDAKSKAEAEEATSERPRRPRARRNIPVVVASKMESSFSQKVEAKKWKTSLEGK
jgi:hypothetical protein